MHCLLDIIVTLGVILMFPRSIRVQDIEDVMGPDTAFTAGLNPTLPGLALPLQVLDHG